jgi:hypothetical protein
MRSRNDGLYTLDIRQACGAPQKSLRFISGRTPMRG